MDKTYRMSTQHSQEEQDAAIPHPILNLCGPWILTRAAPATQVIIAQINFRSRIRPNYRFTSFVV